MHTVDKNDWNRANQQYLMACLNEVKSELELFAALKDKEGEAEIEEVKKSGSGLKAKMPDSQAPPALDTVVTTFNLTSFERKLLLLCAGVELDGEFGKLVAGIQGDSSLLHPSFSLAWAAFPDAHWTAIAPGAPLRYWQLIKLKPGQVLTQSPIRIDEQVLHYLTGVNYMDERLREMADLVQPPLSLVPSQAKIANKILRYSAAENGHAALPLLLLSGKNGLDKAALAAAALTKIGYQLYVVSATAVPAAAAEAGELARLWNREAALNTYALFLDCAKLDESDKSFLRTLTSFIENIQGILILGIDGWKPEARRLAVELAVPKPTPDEQISLWKNSLEGAEKDLADVLKNIVAQFNMSAGSIAQIGKEIRHQWKEDRNGKGPEPFQQILWTACCVHTRPKVGTMAQRIEALAGWDDLVLPEAQKAVLRQVALQVKHRTTVYADWGFAGKTARGLGISALFTGESGTGKTMAAEVLAAELRLDLYRIDLSQVVNKYIGETEKNLKQIFDAAEDGGAILLFDEADALFGKRSDVRDSHDRYSNIEVSYLLQRMEAYRGLAILTTNMKTAIDKAFLRRIRFTVHFPYPDAVLRAEIWRHIFPAGTPVQALDVERLARLNIPGGNIRNIALNAAFLAAGEGQAVQMAHIAQAVRSEYNKIEKALSNAELGGWS